MDIIRITDSDLEDLEKLYQQLQVNHSSIEKMKEALRVVEKNENQIILGAKIEGKLVGSALGVICQMLFGECKAFMVVEDLVVEQDARRSGVGTKLMIELEKYAKENNCSYIMLITDQERKQAHQFYESLEYQSEPFRAFKKKL